MKKVTKSILRIIALGVIAWVAVLLLGCGTDHYFEKVRLMRSDDYHAALVMAQLKKNGVVATQGEEKVSLRIPARYLFYSDSANLNYYSHAVLDNVVKILGYYDSDVVSVVSTNRVDKNTSDMRRAQAIAVERGRQVVKYLWSQNANASFVYPEGKVEHLSQANDKYTEGYVDISFEKFYR